MNALQRICSTISWIALGATIIPSALFFLGKMDLDQVKMAMLIATLVWFVATPFWMGRESSESGADPA